MSKNTSATTRKQQNNGRFFLFFSGQTHEFNVNVINIPKFNFIFLENFTKFVLIELKLNSNEFELHVEY